MLPSRALFIADSLPFLCLWVRGVYEYEKEILKKERRKGREFLRYNGRDYSVFRAKIKILQICLVENGVHEEKPVHR